MRFLQSKRMLKDEATSDELKIPDLYFPFSKRGRFGLQEREDVKRKSI